MHSSALQYSSGSDSSDSESGSESSRSSKSSKSSAGSSRKSTHRSSIGDITKSALFSKSSTTPEKDVKSDEDSSVDDGLDSVNKKTKSIQEILRVNSNRKLSFGFVLLGYVVKLVPFFRKRLSNQMSTV